jgi:hypothetical protein
MKAGTFQKSKKGNGSANMGGMMANAHTEQSVDAPRPEEMIAVAAYFRAEQRGFAPGNEMLDWFQAEAEFNSGSSDTD